MTDEVHHCQAALAVLERFAETDAVAPTAEEFATLKSCFGPIIAELELDPALAWQAIGKHLLWPLHADWPALPCPKEWLNEYRRQNAHVKPNKRPGNRVIDKCRSLNGESSFELPNAFSNLVGSLHDYEARDQVLRGEISSIKNIGDIYAAANLLTLATHNVPSLISGSMDRAGIREFCLSVLEDGFCPQSKTKRGRKSWAKDVPSKIFVTTWLAKKIRPHCITIYKQKQSAKTARGFNPKSLDQQFPKAWRAVASGVPAIFDEGQYDRHLADLTDLIDNSFAAAVGNRAKKMRAVLRQLNANFPGMVSGDISSDRYQNIRRQVIGCLCKSSPAAPIEFDLRSGVQPRADWEGGVLSEKSGLDEPPVDKDECSWAHANALREFVLCLPEGAFRSRIERLLNDARGISEHLSVRTKDAQALSKWINASADELEAELDDGTEVRNCFEAYSRKLRKIYSGPVKPADAVAVFKELAKSTSSHPVR